MSEPDRKFILPLKWTATVSVGLPIVFLIVAYITNAIAALRLHKNYKIGKRMEAECGNEYTEKESRRYHIYEAFKFGVNGNTPTTGWLSIGTILLLLSFAFLMLGFIIFSVLWAVRRMKVSKDNTPLTFSQQQPFIMYGIAVIFLAGTSFFLTFSQQIQQVKEYMSKKYTSVFATPQDNTETTESTPTVSSALISTITSAEPPTFAKRLGTMVKNIIMGPYVPFVIICIFAIWAKLYMEGDEEVDMMTRWYFPVLLFVFFITLVYDVIFKKDITALYDGIETKYQGQLVIGLRTVLNNLVTGASSKVKPVLQDYFANWIRRVDMREMDPNLVLTMEAENLWKYIEHKKDLELEEVEQLGDTSANKYITEIRSYMRKIRAATPEIENATTSYLRHMLSAVFFTVGVLLYVLFHWGYQKSPVYTIYASGGLILLFTFIGTWYGWFSSAILL